MILKFVSKTLFLIKKNKISILSTIYDFFDINCKPQELSLKFFLSKKHTKFVPVSDISKKLQIKQITRHKVVIKFQVFFQKEPHRQCPESKRLPFKFQKKKTKKEDPQPSYFTGSALQTKLALLEKQRRRGRKLVFLMLLLQFI